MSAGKLCAGCHSEVAGFVLAAAALLLAVSAVDALPLLKGEPGYADNSDLASAVAHQPRLLQHGEAVHFQVIGDWGRQGQWNQSETADAMAAAAARAPPAFVISVGDNFYPSGLTSVHDASFADSFGSVYHHAELQVPWYAVLGNHDYGDGIAPGDPAPECREGDPPWRCSAGPLTQLSAELRRRDGRWHCRRSRVLSLADGALDIFMYDTTPFVQYYCDTAWAANPGGIREQSWMSNLAELEAALSESRASWKLVVGHHPVRSNGIEHGGTPELRRWVEPLLHKYGVQLYLAGHDHDLEHLHTPGQLTHHIVSGAGSQIRPEFGGKRDARFQQGAQGFVAVSVRCDALEAAFYGLEGKQPAYTATIAREAGPAAEIVEAAAAAADQQERDSAASAVWEEVAGSVEEAQEAEEAAAASLQAELSAAAVDAAAAFLA